MLTLCLQLRHCLNIKPEQHAVFERFSDSAGGYIILEPTNQQVFKTLIRAAKAKSKLRLKATVTPDPASVTPDATEQTTEDMASAQDNRNTTAEKPVAAIESVDGYDLWTRVDSPIEEEMFRSFARFGSLPSDSPGLTQVRRAAYQTDKLRQDLAGVGDFSSPVPYPDDWFAHKLAGLAAYGATLRR